MILLTFLMTRRRRRQRLLTSLETEKSTRRPSRSLKTSSGFYLSEVDKFRTSSVLAEVLREGIDYVTSLCDAFQTFYASFEDRIGKLDRRIVSLKKKYGNTAGKTTRYVCATPNCLEHLLKEMPYTGNTITIDKSWLKISIQKCAVIP